VVVENSPIHMHCSLENFVELSTGGDQALVVLVVDTFVIDGSVLSEPTAEMKKRPNVTAKIDAQLIKPLVSFGEGRVKRLKNIRSMPRPIRQENGVWTSTNFDVAPETTGPGGFETTEWIFKRDGGTCPLGYNALTALVMPRPIGWISTFRKEGRVPHIAPYSFFSDVARCGDKPMVAFSGYRRNGQTPKDAEQDSIDSGYFAFNMVTEALAVPMNLSAAEISSEASEFDLSMLKFEPANAIDAPVVVQSPIRFECKYIRSVPIGSFSIVIGEVIGISVHEAVVESSTIDISKVNAVTRLGFMDEYGTIDM
jgi:flavin reductase (DIM6/NTAB) family NADH-FMN oxidoreductase RutF